MTRLFSGGIDAAIFARKRKARPFARREHFRRRARLSRYFAQSAAAQTQTGKELTVDRLFRAPSLGGRLTQGIEWAPDGKRFSYLDRQGYGKDAVTQLWTMDASTGERKVLVNAETLKSVMQPEKAKTSQATGLGRVQADNYLWSPDGNSLLFIGSNSLVLLDLKTMTPKPLVSSEQEIEDPKFSPDSRWISFSRSANLFVVNIASGAVTTLTTGGSEEILKGKLDWVYPEELDTRTAYWWSPDSTKIAYYEMDERPVTRYSDRGHELAHRRHRIHALSASRRSESHRARRRRQRHRRRDANGWTPARTPMSILRA